MNSFAIDPVFTYSCTMALCSLVTATSVTAQDCEWSNVGFGIDNEVKGLLSFEEDNKPVLYAGGILQYAGGNYTPGIAKWDGSDWLPVGTGLSGIVWTLFEYDDGSGPAVLAGGAFGVPGSDEVGGLARWTGSEWVPVGGARISSDVRGIVVFDDGTGPALYIGGWFDWFEDDNYQEYNYVAKYDGNDWSDLGGGTNSRVNAITVFDDGTGQALYVAGHFTMAGNVPANYIAKWDGKQWSALGEGIGLDRVFGMVAIDADQPGGPALYVGGNFHTAGGKEANHVAKWDGKEWSPLGEGVDLPVMALTVFDDGTGNGPELFVGGYFTTAGGRPAERVAKWDGQEWTPVGYGFDAGRVHAFAVHDEGFGPSLIVGGAFHFAGGIPADYIVRWRCEPIVLPAPLTDLQVVFGQQLSGNLDSLREDDDDVLRLRSAVGFSALEPSITRFRVGAHNEVDSPTGINLAITARINHPTGVAKVRLKNWMTNQYTAVAEYTLTNIESTESIVEIDAMNFIRASDDRIEVDHQVVVAAVFSALGFDAMIERVGVETF